MGRLFKGQAEGTPSKTSDGGLAWAAVDSELQQMWVDFNRVEFELMSRASGTEEQRTPMQLHLFGIAKSGALNGKRVIAEVVEVQQGLPPLFASADWSDEVEVVDGYARAMDHDGLGVALYVTMFSLRPIGEFARLALAAAGPAGGLGCSLLVDYPVGADKPTGVQFWKIDWVQKYLRVKSWKIIGRLETGNGLSHDA
jgi:hypothetical protein